MKPGGNAQFEALADQRTHGFAMVGGALAGLGLVWLARSATRYGTEEVRAPFSS